MNSIIIDVVPRLLGDKLGGQAIKMGQQASQAIAKPMNAAVNATGLAVLAGLAVALTAGAKAAVEFEDAFAMVKKTMADVKDPEVFKEIEKDLLNLATQIPISANELAGVASVAGQLGVAADDIAVFTEVTAKLGVATNMTATQAATGLARFLNVTGESTDSVGKFGSVLVQLGNNVAAQESEILLLAQNFGATGNVAGLATEDILAFSAATRAAGVQAAAGSTALGKLFMNISNAVKENDLERLSVASRLIGRDFKTAFEQDGAMAVQELLTGLSALAQEGQSVTPILQTLGLNNVRTSRAVLALANNNKGLAAAIKLARTEAVVSNALNNEVATRMDTVSSKVQQLKTAFNALLIPLGNVFIPVFKTILDFAINIVNGFLALQRVFSELTDSVKGFLTSIGALAAIETATKLFGRFTNQVGKSGKVMEFLSTVFQKVGPFIKKALGPLIAVLSALNALGKQERKIRDFEKQVESMAGTFEDLTIDGTAFSEAFTEEIFLGIVEGLPEAMREGVQQGVKQGTLTEQGLEASQALADGLTEGLVDELRNVADVGNLVFSNVNFDEIIETLEAEGLTENSEIFKLVEKIKEEKAKGAQKDKEMVESLQQQLQTHLLIIEAERNALNFAEQLQELVVAELEAQGRLADAATLRHASDRTVLSVAKDLKGVNEDILALLVQQGIVQAANLELTPFQKMIEEAGTLKAQIESIFLGADLDFAAQFAEMDLAEAKQEQIDLQQEEVDLKAEQIELAEELLDLEKEQIVTAEELKEQQDLINEALEIEERIRTGFSLTANQQLRREKLRKERRRVELAAAQGSLEFADLELKNIDEQIAAIEDKAVTEEDAQKLRNEAAEITQKAQIRREQEIEDIKNRQVAIAERLVELPREQLEAQKAIHDAQKETLLTNLEIIASMEKLQEVSVTSAQAMARALKLPTVAKEALVGGATTSGVSVSGFRSQFGVEEKLGDFRTFQGIANSRAGSNKSLPEMLTADDAAAFRNSGSSMLNNITINGAGVPADPMQAKKFAKDINRELVKLQTGTGRSGAIR